MSRGVWRDPRLGEQPLGEWFRGWIATRADLAPSTRELYARLLERWIDAEVPVVGGARPRSCGWGRCRWRPSRRPQCGSGTEQSLARLGTSGAGPFSATKSRAGLRTVALPAVAVEVLAEHMARFTPERRDALVFGTASRRPLTSGSRSTMFARARRAVGRDGLTWRDLRHSALTLVALAGATLAELMQRAGHSTPRAALHYQHAADDAQERIAERIDRLLNAPAIHAGLRSASPSPLT